MKYLTLPFLIVSLHSAPIIATKTPVYRYGSERSLAYDEAPDKLALLFKSPGKSLQAGTPMVRKNVFSLSAATIASLRKAVQVMKAKGPNDPTSWSYQAAIHGTIVSPVKTGWNKCQHGSFFFLAWHRMYVYYFERIMRKASGDPSFTLPYWNYTLAGQTAMPAIFRQPANSTTNPLFTAQRSPQINQGFGLPASVTSNAAAFAQINFITPSLGQIGFGGLAITTPQHFGSNPGQLENQPHNVVHDQIGGWMSDPNTAAQDPIFWMHHCNIDRLWEKWLQLGAGRANPTTNTAWMNTTFTFFDENGATVSLKGSQILNTATQLNYKYDDDKVATNQPVAFSKVNPAKQVQQEQEIAQITPSKVTARRTQIALAPNKPVMESFMAEMKVADRKKPQEPSSSQVVLRLEGITYVNPPTGTYEVYVNLPKGVIPDYRNNYYAGNIGLFGASAQTTAHQHGSQKGISVNLDITRILHQQHVGNEDVKNVTVTLYLRELTAPSGVQAYVPKGELTIAKIRVLGFK